MIICKSSREIRFMVRAGKLAAQVQEKIAEIIAPGLKTQEIDDLAEDFIRQNGGVPAFKGYRGFPASVCVSVNQEVVHGIPGPRILKEGDIVSLDVGTLLDGYYGDCARTYGVGEISQSAHQLMEVTRKSLQEGIKMCQPGGYLSDISHAIQSFVEGQGFSVVRDYVGHGIGQAMHEPPQVPNFGPPGRGPVLKEGMTLAIEPMVNAGTHEVRVEEDGWTVVTVDGMLSAHFEDTVAITENGPEILTKP